MILFNMKLMADYACNPKTLYLLVDHLQQEHGESGLPAWSYQLILEQAHLSAGVHADDL